MLDESDHTSRQDVLNQPRKYRVCSERQWEARHRNSSIYLFRDLIEKAVQKTVCELSYRFRSSFEANGKHFSQNQRLWRFWFQKIKKEKNERGKKKERASNCF